MAINNQVVTGLAEGFDTRANYQVWGYTGRLWQDKTTKFLGNQLADGSIIDDATGANPIRIWEDLDGNFVIAGTLDVTTLIGGGVILSIVDLSNAAISGLAQTYQNEVTPVAISDINEYVAGPLIRWNTTSSPLTLELLNLTVAQLPAGSTISFTIPIYHQVGQ